MKIVHVLNQIGYGGTEKAAILLARWAQRDGHEARLVAFTGGPREAWARTLLGSENVHVGTGGVPAEADIVHRHVGEPTGGPITAGKSKYVESQIFGHVSDPLPDLTIFVSPEIAARVYEREPGIPANKFAVLRNPIRYPSDDFVNRRLDGIEVGTIVVGSLGRPDDAIFDPVHLFALKMWIEANPKKPILYVRLGCSNAEAAMLRELEIPHRILEPTCSDGEITRFFHSLDLYLHSRLDGECDSTSIAEAMIHGVRVLSHAGGTFKGHVEALMPHLDFCDVAPASDPEAYCESLTRMLTDEDRWRQAKEILPSRVARRQGVQLIGERCLELYKSLLA